MFIGKFQAAWIDGIKGKFKRGRRTVSSYVDAANALRGENGYDRSPGEEELGEERLVSQTSNGHKRARLEFELDSPEDHYESGELSMNGHAKEPVR